MLVTNTSDADAHEQQDSSGMYRTNVCSAGEGVVIADDVDQGATTSGLHVLPPTSKSRFVFVGRMEKGGMI